MARTVDGATAAGRKGGGGSRLWLLGLVSGAVATLATPTAVLACGLLAPCIVVGMLDTRPGRPALRPVLLCGLAASLRPLLSLWHSGHTMQDSMALLEDSSILATAWAAQAGAWLLAELAPVAIRLTLDGQSLARAAALRMARRRYEDEWGFAPISDISAALETPPSDTAKRQT